MHQASALISTAHDRKVKDICSYFNSVHKRLCYEPKFYKALITYSSLTAVKQSRACTTVEIVAGLWLSRTKYTERLKFYALHLTLCSEICRLIVSVSPATGSSFPSLFSVRLRNIVIFRTSLLYFSICSTVVSKVTLRVSKPFQTSS